MVLWFKTRLKIIQLTLRKPILLVVFGIFQTIQWILDIIPGSKLSASLSQLSMLMPWYGWVIGWLVLLWSASLEYSVKRKEVFDETSIAFFKAYLDFLINEGGKLFDHSMDKNFYSKINAWQHQVIQGIAIGLGPEESQKLYQKMDKPNSVSAENRESLALKTSEALCRTLQENIEELKAIKIKLLENQEVDESSPNPAEKPKLIDEPKQ